MFKLFKPLGKILGNSLKISLKLIFHNVNLTLVNVTWFNKIQMKDLTLAMNLNQDTM
jgi:hypothetical protein